MDNESSGSESEADTAGFVNPLAKKKTIDVAGNLSEGEWSDDGDEGKPAKKVKKEKKTKLTKRKRGDVDGSDDEKKGV